MYGIGYISPSVNQTLTPSATLGAPGDMYIITDTRQRPRKDLSETKAFQRFDIRTLNAEELAKMQAEDPLLYEQIKADMSTSGSALTEPTATVSVSTTAPTVTQSSEIKKSNAVVSPLMRQYNKIKSKYPDAVVLFKVLDYYETFGDDAEIVAKTLNLHLRNRNGEKLVGFPAKDFDANMLKLVNAGIRTAVVENLEEAIEKAKTSKLKNPSLSTQEKAKRIKEYKSAINELADIQKLYKDIYYGGKIPKDLKIRFSAFGNEGDDKLRKEILMSLNFDFDAKRDSFRQKLARELIEERNSDLVDDVIEYLKQFKLFNREDYIWDMSIKSDATLGKPTIKFEFEDNAALADFLHATKKAADFADFEDVTNTATSAKPNAPKSKIRNGRLMPADDSRYLPESPAPYSLPPTNTPPQLPTSPTSTAKALPPYVEPTPEPTSTQSDETPEVTAESVTEDEIESANVAPVTLDWDDFEKRFAKASNDENSNYRIEYDTQEDRVKIIFNGMPSAQAREWLKKNGFRWSPRNKAWQRQITDNARRAVEQFKASGLGKPTIKLEFEDNADLMSLFDTDGINGMTVNDKPADIFNCPESQLQTRGYKPTYIRLNDYSHLIATADGRKTLKGYGFESATLDELVNACRYYPQVAALAAHLKDPNGDPLQTAFNDWHWLHTNIRYDYDTPGEEEIRTPARVWRDRFSGVDCDCLAVMTACLLINQGFHPCFEIVAFNNEPTFSHIYVTLDGAAIDRVLPVFLARPDNITKTQIMEIPVYSLSGIGGCRDTLNGVYSSTLAKIQSGTATGEDNNDFRKTQVLVTLRGIDDAAYSLAALLMPHIVTIADDGTYYFDSTAMANLATKLDDDLRQLMADDADPETISQWIATAAQQIDGAASVQSNGGKDTIVVIVNPQGNMTRVIGQMVKASTPTLTATTADAINTPAAAASSTPAIMQTSPMPGVAPDGETESDSSDWWKYALAAAAAFGAGAMVTKSGKKPKKRK